MKKRQKGQSNRENTSDKQRLKETLPYGMLATKRWLRTQGFNVHTIDNAVKSQRLFVLTPGVYSQYTASVSWEGVVASLQQMNLKETGLEIPSILVGGLTALDLHGLSHYLSMGEQPTIDLYGEAHFPKWLDRVPLPVNFRQHVSQRLWSADLLQDESFIKTHVWQQSLPPIFFSCPEKAILEVLLHLPKTISFEHADQLMQGLVNLSPRKLDALLRGCQSIKVKRLFCWLAQRQAYPWFKKLNVKDYDLGSGKRLIAKGGKLEANYQITVPSHMLKQKGDDLGLE